MTGLADPPPPKASQTGVRQLVPVLVLVVAGAFLIGFLWEILNGLLAGQGSGRSVLGALLLILGLVGLLRYLMRVIAQLDSGGTRNVG